MPFGLGTYGSKRGRPPKRTKRQKKSAKKYIRETVYNRLRDILK